MGYMLGLSAGIIILYHVLPVEHEKRNKFIPVAIFFPSNYFYIKNYNVTIHLPDNSHTHIDAHVLTYKLNASCTCRCSLTCDGQTTKFSNLANEASKQI